MKLGDLIEKITTITGIKKLTGDCNSCRKRKKKLNKINAIGTACWIVLLLCCIMVLINSNNGNYQSVCDWGVIGGASLIIMFYSLTRKK